MAEAFPIVLIAVVVVALIAAFLAFLGAGKVYEGIGRGAFALDQADRPKGPEPGSQADGACDPTSNAGEPQTDPVG